MGEGGWNEGFMGVVEWFCVMPVNSEFHSQEPEKNGSQGKICLWFMKEECILMILVKFPLKFILLKKRRERTGEGERKG